MRGEGGGEAYSGQTHRYFSVRVHRAHKAYQNYNKGLLLSSIDAQSRHSSST